MKVAAILLLLAAACPGAARAAFEAVVEDPALLGVAAAGPAWPLPGRPAADRPLVFGGCAGRGFAICSTRMDAVPELNRQALAAWFRARGAVVALRVRRLALAGYAETQAFLEVCRPAAGTGWGWALGVGRQSWSADLSAAVGEAGWHVDGALGFAPRPDLRMAGRLTRGGTLELGVTADPAPRWRAGIGSEAARDGLFGRVKVGLECRPAAGAVLRAGLVPADGGATVGLGVRRGILALDIARRDDPNLGAVTCVGFAVVAAPGGAP